MKRGTWVFPRRKHTIEQQQRGSLPALWPVIIEVSTVVPTQRPSLGAPHQAQLWLPKQQLEGEVVHEQRAELGRITIQIGLGQEHVACQLRALPHFREYALEGICRVFVCVELGT